MAAKIRTMEGSNAPEASATMRESEERFRKIFENAATGIAITDWEGRFQQCNPAYCALLGYSEQELHEVNFASLIHPEDRQANLTEVRRLLAGDVPSFEIENRYLHRDGRPIWVHKFVSVLPDETGKPAYQLALITDITERKRAGAALRESEEKLRLLIEHAPVALAMFDRQMRYLAVSRRWLADYRLGDKEIIGRSHYEVFPAIPDRWRDAHRRGLEGEVVTADEDVFPGLDGKNHYERWEVRPWNQADGAIGGIVILTEDLSARKRAEEALRQRDAESRRLLEYHQAVMVNMGEGLYTVDTQGLVTYMNPAAESILGWKSAELLGRRMHDMTHYQYPDGRPFPIEECAGFQVLHEGKVLKDRDDVFIRRDGGFFPVVYTTAPLVTDGKVAGQVVVFRDVTERKHAEQRLRASEARMQAILNTATDAIITMDVHGIIQSVNPASARMFGYAAAEMVGQNVGLIMPSPYREEHDGYLRQYLQTGNKHIIGASRELYARRKDGSIFPMHLTVSEIEERKLFTGILRDMTEYKRLEREVVEVASQEQQRIGQDLHDIVAQELTALNLLAGTMAESLETDPANATKLLQRMKQGLRRSQQELRAVLRGLVPVAVGGDGLMAALIELADRTCKEGQVTCKFDCPKPVTIADNLTATHLYLIAQEAVNNAVKHGKPRNVCISLHANPQLALRVQCDGIGMPARPEEKGGMGLRIMRNRAAIIGAHLTIEPAEPCGTIVTCCLLCKEP